jgi:16S rRNA (adenine1518-N6/adenine1519-N6)-dimethyltransferase
MAEELFEVIDESGKVLCLKPRGEVHAKGLLHKGVYIALFDGSGRIFMQRRAACKDIMPLRWDFSAAGHLKPGESYAEAAARELKEELGVGGKNFEKLAEVRFRYNYGNAVDNEANWLFKCGFDGEIKIGRGEVAEGKFVPLKKVLAEIGEKPEKFVPWAKCLKKPLEKFI